MELSQRRNAFHLTIFSVSHPSIWGGMLPVTQHVIRQWVFGTLCYKPSLIVSMTYSTTSPESWRVGPFRHNNLFIYLYVFINSFTYLFSYLFIYLFIHSFVHLFIHPFIHSSIHPFFYLFTHLFIHSVIQSSVYRFMYFILFEGHKS
jgi:hypothetical protein